MKFQSLFSFALTTAAAFSLPAVVSAQTQIYLLSQQTSMAQISGKVARMSGDDEFILNTLNGQIRVDADSSLLSTVKLTVGEQVTVSGQYDDDEFNGYTLTRTNGESFNIRD